MIFFIACKDPHIWRWEPLAPLQVVEEDVHQMEAELRSAFGPDVGWQRELVNICATLSCPAVLVCGGLRASLSMCFPRKLLQNDLSEAFAVPRPSSIFGHYSDRST